LRVVDEEGSERICNAVEEVGEVEIKDAFEERCFVKGAKFEVDEEDGKGGEGGDHGGDHGRVFDDVKGGVGHGGHRWVRAC